MKQEVLRKKELFHHDFFIIFFGQTNSLPIDTVLNQASNDMLIRKEKKRKTHV